VPIVAGERGQATLEYLGVVMLVAVVLGLGAVLTTGAGEAIAGGVGRGMRRALCVVRAGECDLETRPCIVGSSNVEDDGSVDLVVVHVGSNEVVLREDRSDGSSAVTFARLRRGGLEIGTGAGARVRLGRRRFRVGGQASATLLALSGRATTWNLPDRAAAARLVDRIVVDSARDLGRRILDRGRPAGDDAPEPAVRSAERGARVEFEGSRGRGSFSLASQDLVGSSVDIASGRRTYLVRRRNSRGAVLAGTLEGDSAGDELYTVTTARDGRPLDLGILRAGEVAGSVTLPKVVQPVAGYLDVPATPSAGRHWEVEEHLDLTEPASRDVARAFLAQVVHPHPHLGRVVAVSAALRRALDDRGVLDARTYDVTQGAPSGVGIGGRLGVRAGVDYERRSSSTRLVAAMERGTDGMWRRRDDCLTAPGVGARHGASGT
jgi:hypothetical protein